MSYKLFTYLTPEGVERTIGISPDNAQFELTEDNADYRLYQAWLAEGNTPEPWENE